MSNYNKYPETKIKNYNAAFSNKEEIINFLKEYAKEDNYTLCVECYPGVDNEVLDIIREGYAPDTILLGEDIFYDGDTLTDMMQPFLTEDRVRGVMYYGIMEDFIDQDKLEKMKNTLPNSGRTLIYGVGASFLSKGDTLIYCDMARWEIQLRYRKGMPNFKQKNYDEDTLKKIKRGFFVEWRIADKRKMEIFEEIDYFLDSNTKGEARMVDGPSLRNGLKEIVQQPFRLVPYFDPGVWGGQWMKEVCDLDKDADNYAWAFDGVPEENSLYLRFGETRIEIPAMDLVLYQPKELLGMKNYCRFGAEFPIRFDFLDTMDGQNLSLQVHPLTEYIKSHYGMTYTQDESYYILDAKEDGGVYLGLKDNVNPEEFEYDLLDAQKGNQSFPAEKYVNKFPAKKHDHFMIPAGTIHCSASNSMVLEISATPYIFTFKLWDWDRLGLDGLPRPIHIEDGMKNIQWDRTTDWVKENLVNPIEVLHDDSDYKEEKTGLHEYEFIETRRYTTKNKVTLDASEGVHMCNLVDGDSAMIMSEDSAYEPYVVHYAETFIIPSACGKYTIQSTDGNEIKVMVAYVRQR